MVDNSGTFEVCYINVGVYSKLNDYMEIYMYQRSQSFLDLCPSSLRMNWISDEQYRTIGSLVLYC